MKRILITGKDSYIGTHFKEYLAQYPDAYHVEELDVRDDTWKAFDFTRFDCVYHVAGIAHIKEKKENKELYDQVNRDLTIEIAKKAKEGKVKQFVFMSSMSVYGLTHTKETITIKTACHPNTYYGMSKYQAEMQLRNLADNTFRVCIVRPPMVYGNNAPGNLGKLLKAVRRIHIFPTIPNQRSSITVEKLVECIKEYVDSEAQGVYLPQNDTYMCTYEIIKETMEAEGVHVCYTSVFNPVIRLLIGKSELVTKCFGDLKYER